MSEERPAPGPSAPADAAEHRYYRGTISRVYYGSETGTLVSEATGREYQFKYPFVEIIGPIPRIDGLRAGMTVGFDLGWTSRGRRVTVIRVF
ncbi:MAG TPA: hypothetical protein VKA21_15900 [Candidatus Binatia bacterium]|nr:hypothetical protein [Candidatus Binatia bacterium]